MYTEAQKKTLELISKIGIIPVIAIDDAAKAVPLARALVKGGLPAAARRRQISSAIFMYIAPFVPI